MSSKIVTIAEAQQELAELVEQALQGDEILLGDSDTPLVRLVPVSQRAALRVPGLNRGEGWISDDFDAPLPDDFWTSK